MAYLAKDKSGREILKGFNSITDHNRTHATMMATTYKGSWIPIYNVRLRKHHHFDKLQSTLGELERNEEYRLKHHSLFCEDLQKSISLGISLFLKNW